MNQAQTENGALSYATTGSKVLDLFFKVLRDTKTEQLDNLLSESWAEDPLLTLKAIFHLRDCRGGKGEKARFYDAIKWLMKSNHTKHVLKNLEHVPFYGTYKDLLILCAGTDLEFPMLQLFASTLAADIDLLVQNVTDGTADQNKRANISLAGKWAPTEGSSLDKKYHLARKITGLLKKRFKPSVGVNNLKDYRTRVITPLRNHLEVVERYMCSMNWDEINFSHVPSLAMKNYRKAFAKHDEDRFRSYLEDVKSGKAKINSGQLFPHQLVQYYMNEGKYDETIEAQWNEIVRTARMKFRADKKAFALVDVSGSMCGLPMEVAIALGLLLAEIADEPFRGSVLTFTEQPSFCYFNTEMCLRDKVECIKAAPWGTSTNLMGAFELLLKTALLFKASECNMPNTLYIFSDMQFDQACPKNSFTNFQLIEEKYMSHGYKRPNVVFWNLRGDTVDFPIEKAVPNTALISGFSPSLMELFMTGDTIEPYNVMLKALNSPRYSRIELAPEQ